MKRIIDYCNNNVNIQGNGFLHEGVKLRLRGKGSGFLEGPEQRESLDPLNLCVSSKDKQKYNVASNEVESLLIRIYQDFNSFDKSRSSR